MPFKQLLLRQNTPRTKLRELFVERLLIRLVGFCWPGSSPACRALYVIMNGYQLATCCIPSPSRRSSKRQSWPLRPALASLNMLCRETHTCKRGLLYCTSLSSRLKPLWALRMLELGRCPTSIAWHNIIAKRFPDWNGKWRTGSTPPAGGVSPLSADRERRNCFFFF